MALLDYAWYVDFGDGATTGYYGVTKWSNHTAVAGEIIRQNTGPAVGSERCFICIVAGATGAVEPTWTNTRGAKNVSSSATYQECTGIAAINGDTTNTATWSTLTSNAAFAVTLGQVIKRNNGASYWICSTAGTTGASEPAWANDTAGTTRTDGTATWTCLGVVGNFTGWQAPAARMTNAMASTWGQAGNTFFIASESAETIASAVTVTPIASSSITAMTKVYCVAKTPVPPTATTTGAQIATTGNSNWVINGGMYAIFDGISFKCNAIWSCINSATASHIYFKNCTLGPSTQYLLTNAAAPNSRLFFDNCTWTWNSSATAFTSSNCTGDFRMRGGSIGGANLPASTCFTSYPQGLVLDGVDLTAFTTGKTIVGAVASSAQAGDITLKNCSLGSGVTIATTPTAPGQRVNLISSDSSTAAYRHEVYEVGGTQTVETTIVRTGGATDGTTPLSWKIVTTSSASWISPFEAAPIRIWNAVAGSQVTATIYGIWGGGAVPNNDDIWFEAEYMGSSSTPVTTFTTTSKASALASNAALSSDNSTWGGSTTKFKITKNFTANMAGYVYIYIKAGASSSTFYIDPLPTVA